MGATAKYKFSLELGALIRGRIIREIESYCHVYDITFDKAERKGWLSSTFLCIAEGPVEAITHLRDQLVSLEVEFEDEI